MLTIFETVVRSAVFSQTAPGGDTALYLMGFALVIAVGVIAWAIPKTKSLASTVAGLTQDVSELKAKQKSAGEKRRKQTKELDEKRDELKKLKRDLGSFKKKNHEAQEELKKLKAELKDQESRYQKKLANKSAHQAPKKTDKPKSEEAKPQAPAVKGVTLAELQDKVEKLEAQNESLQNNLQTDREKSDKSRSELRRVGRKLEDLRKADLIAKGKVDTLHERLKHLGHQYYDAVSEIAVLKGEVAPPPPPEVLAEKKKPKKSEAKKPEADTESTKTDTGTETETESTKTDTGTETESTKTDTGTETESAKTDTGTETGSAKTDAGTETESAKTDAKTQTESPKTESVAEAKPVEGDATEENDSKPTVATAP